MVAPTSSGKTFVAEMAATSLAYRTRRQVIFVVPFRALADEHYLALKRRYEGLLSVVIATGDWAEFDADIRDGNFGIAVMTYENGMEGGPSNTHVVDWIHPDASSKDFSGLAESLARQIGLEVGPRQLLLIPMDVFSDAVLRCAEGRLDSSALLDALGRASGVLDLEDLVHGDP